jgi:SAM-dependent methyltransferase
VALAALPFDVNAPWAPQDAAPDSLTLVWGVNVFHLARELDAVLAEARAALRPGGWLVVGEGLRPCSGVPVAAELPFQLLDSFGAVQLHPEHRPTAGFLTASEWRAALHRAGFEAVRIVPDADRIQALCPVFLGGAACGRRPAA